MDCRCAQGSSETPLKELLCTGSPETPVVKFLCTRRASNLIGYRVGGVSLHTGSSKTPVPEFVGTGASETLVVKFLRTRCARNLIGYKGRWSIAAHGDPQKRCALGSSETPLLEFLSTGSSKTPLAEFLRIPVR